MTTDMAELDLVIRNGTMVTASERYEGDLGVASGKIAAIGRALPRGGEELDATGRLVLPGGIDAHCHIEQRSSTGLICADDFASGTVSAAFGGTTTIMPFAAQHRGDSVERVVADYHRLASEKAVVDYAFHLILSDPTEAVLTRELPAVIAKGCTSFKVYMTYDALKLDDYQMLEVLAVARREGAFTMVHAENHDMIRWLTERLLAAGHWEPKFHAVAHARLAEAEATSRAIHLAELVDVPLLVVHVSTEEGLKAIRDSRRRGLEIYGETCPQYLFLTADDLDSESEGGMAGAMCCCSPPPRDEASQEAMWEGLSDGGFHIFSSDHAPYRFDETGKLAHGKTPPFNRVANGVPGLELRLPLLFSEGVAKGRIDLHRFVEVTATAPARIYGLAPRKGTLAIGADADIAIWDPELEVEITAGGLHDQVGYTPYEGRTIRGWPVVVLSRGRVVVRDSELLVERGSGEFIPRERWGSRSESRGRTPDRELARRFGAGDILS